MDQFRGQIITPLEDWIQAEEAKQEAGFSPFFTHPAYVGRFSLAPRVGRTYPPTIRVYTEGGQK